MTTVVMIVWWLDLQLHVQSVPITTKVVNSNPVHGDVYSIQHYVIKFVSDLQQVGGFLYTTLCDKVCQWLAAGRWFSPGNLVSSTNKTDCHDITEILLKVELSTINQPFTQLFSTYQYF